MNVYPGRNCCVNTADMVSFSRQSLDLVGSGCQLTINSIKICHACDFSLVCAVSSYLWSISSRRESAGWGVGLLRLESRFYPFIALRLWLSNFISSAPLPNLDPCRFFSCSDTGLTRCGFQLSWLFYWVFVMPGFVVQQSDCYIYASRCVHWRFVVVPCSLS